MEAEALIEVRFDDSFARAFPELCEPWQAEPNPDPRLLVLNRDLATQLGFDPVALERPEGVALLVGAAVPAGVQPVAQAYAGHQFGGFAPRLGDGRALLIGEVVDPEGGRRDFHLKGSGRTPFARGGDGRAAVGPMLREYVISEAMHALGIPTTRSLAVVATGEQVNRERLLPGAVLTRVAASHIRVGTFQYAALQRDPALVQRLADHVIARHHPQALQSENPYVALLRSVIDVQASLVARWMAVGFVHGVMNTDNTTISGETIDYGPCAFLDAFDPQTVFSSIDHSGRYAFGNQSAIAQWNLARLAETLLPLIAADPDEAVAHATEVLHTFAGRYREHWGTAVRAKLGLRDCHDDDLLLGDDLLAMMHRQQVDLTSAFRGLSSLVRGDARPVRVLFGDPAPFDAWVDRYRTRLAMQAADPKVVAAEMDRVNPLYIPRNHRVEEALDAATAGDLDPFRRLVDAVSQPFDERPGLEGYAVPAPHGGRPYRTFCGT